MKSFLELVENMRMKGFVQLRTEEDKFDEIKPHQVPAKLWSDIEACQPFVFATPLNEAEELEWGNRAEFQEMDAPFARCSVEVLGAPCIMNDRFVPEGPDDKPRRISCMFGTEISPKDFDVYALMDFTTGIGKRVLRVGYSKPNYGHIMHQYFQRLRREAVGYEAVRERMTVGTGKEKRIVRLRRLVHVVPKKLQLGYQDGPGRSVDWSHRWMVRGHWVSLPGKIGKDRAGDYCVQDWTWRSEHEKGPENAPLINKTRFVGSESPKGEQKDG